MGCIDLCKDCYLAEGGSSIFASRPRPTNPLQTPSTGRYSPIVTHGVYSKPAGARYAVNPVVTGYPSVSCAGCGSQHLTEAWGFETTDLCMPCYFANGGTEYALEEGKARAKARKNPKPPGRFDDILKHGSPSSFRYLAGFDTASRQDNITGIQCAVCGNAAVTTMIGYGTTDVCDSCLAAPL